MKCCEVKRKFLTQFKIFLSTSYVPADRWGAGENKTGTPLLHGPEGLSAEADVKQNHTSTWVINNDSHQGEVCGAESSQGTGVGEERIC